MNFEFLKLYEEVDKINEETAKRTPHKQQLQKDLFYNTVEDVVAGKEPLVQYTKITSEALLQNYSQAGFIDDKDNIVFPAGTIFTWVKTIEPDKYDIYHVQGKNKCFIAVEPRSVVELFGNNAYKE